MATKNYVPRVDGEGQIGTTLKKWLKGWFGSIFLGTSGIVDSTANEVLKPESVASAVNEITIKNAATGTAPEMKSTGDNAVIDFIIRTKGIGKVQLLDGSSNEIAEFHTVASAVNFLKTISSATGVTLTIEAIGTDANISITLVLKGTGQFIISGASGLKTAAITLGATLLTPTGAELNFVKDVTSAIQTQLNAKAPLAAPTFTGNIKRSVQVGITAFATGGQANAVAIVADIAEISICATGGDSVKLPTAVAGLVIKIINHGAAAADVFPNTDDAINEAAANTAKSLGIDASMLCIAYNAVNWECLILAR